MASLKHTSVIQVFSVRVGDAYISASCDQAAYVKGMAVYQIIYSQSSGEISMTRGKFACRSCARWLVSRVLKLVVVFQSAAYWAGSLLVVQ